MNRRAALLLMLALAACSSDEQPPAPANDSEASLDNRDAAEPVPADAVANVPGALPAPEFAGASMAKGGWTLKTVAGGKAALFGPSESEARFSVRCDPDHHRIVFARAGTMPAKDAAMHIATDTGAATFPAQAADASMPEVVAESVPSFPFLTENLAGNPHRIAVKLGDESAFVMPGDPAVGAVIESCQH